MKKSMGIFLVLFVSFFNLSIIKADCNDIKSEAELVGKNITNIGTRDYITVKIDIGDLTEKIYIVVLNDYNDEVKTYHYSDTKDGLVSFETIDVNEKINYIVRVYSEDTTCGIEPINTISFKTSSYNPYSLNDICDNDYNFEMCNYFYDVENMTLDEFRKQVSKLIEEEEKPFSKKLIEFMLKYGLYVLIPFVLIVMIFVIRIIIFKRGKKNV